MSHLSPNWTPGAPTAPWPPGVKVRLVDLAGREALQVRDGESLHAADPESYNGIMRRLAMRHASRPNPN